MPKIYFIGGSGYLGNYISNYIPQECFNLRSWELFDEIESSSTLLYLSGESNTKLFENLSFSSLKSYQKKLLFYCKRKLNLIYFSSTSVMQSPITKYAKFKLECERICEDHGKTIIRLSSVFGGEYKRNIIVNDIYKIINNKKDKLISPNSYVNISSINSLTKSIFKILQIENKNHIFNLCMKNSIKASDLLDIAFLIKKQNNVSLNYIKEFESSETLNYDTSSSEKFLSWDSKLPITDLKKHFLNL
ncbi:MAG: hypothetical protein JJ848_000345 [Prochlorococcus marinus CUG1439]|uniref:hypothetical protein n=1 Tax=Prochlorococcus sp. MIT 1314 TaxID=3096220 RepID=UPI001B2053DE|nr:hypothetical protein [Prochlorococcus sp. MIT 1314]MCR8538790.1 hypothetical protein [Prochlorococcus marinus CUG1439]